MKVILNKSNGEMLYEPEKPVKTELPYSDWEITGIRIGSETCSRLMESIHADRFRMQIRKIKDAGLDVFVVFPNVSQANWNHIMTLIDICAEENIDGITANDFGVLSEAVNRSFKKIILGRLFDRRMRDPRVGTIWNEKESLESPAILTDEYIDLYRREHLYAVETECFGLKESIPEDVKLLIHVPYLLLTSGRFCETGGIGNDTEKKFRPNTCLFQCRKIRASGDAEFLRGKWYQYGNAIYSQIKKSTLMEILKIHKNTEIIYTEQYKHNERNDKDYGSAQ